jgi:hypothetical protein
MAEFGDHIPGLKELNDSLADRSAGWETITKSANQNVENVALENDTEFTFSVVAGGHYAVAVDLIISGNNTTSDYQFDFNVSAGTMKGKGVCLAIDAAGALASTLITAAGAASTTAIVIGAPTADLDDLMFATLTFAFTASSNGTFRFRFGNALLSLGRISRTWKDSVMRYKQID